MISLPDDLGIVIPEKLNPGPVIESHNIFAIDLGFFFLLVATITIVCRIPIHPMHYLFVAGGFCLPSLLLAYLVDHIPMVKKFCHCRKIEAAPSMAPIYAVL